jgi:glycine/D-amino acid oxidase-like deaminating enzyme
MAQTDSPTRAPRPGRLDINPAGVPYWWDAAPPGEDLAGELPSSADVVVIGAGWTGLSAALTLARAGREVLVLDANAPGTGASTRNAGYFGSQLRASLRALIHRYGESTALDLARVAERGFAFSKNLIESEQISCDLQDLGRLTCAARPAHYETMARDAELSHRVLGVECQILTAAELRRELGTDQYYGGEFRPSAWCMHPGKYVSGLLERVRSAGATVRGDTLVTGLDRRDKRVITEHGCVTARNVLVATNAYTGEFIPELKRRLIPIGANVIATEELDEAILRAVFPRPRLGIDTRRLYRAFRPSPDGSRILFTGRSRDPRRGAEHNGEMLRRQLVELFPVLSGVTITHSWGGYVGFTFDYLPHLGEHDGIHYAMGFNGAGATMAPYLGNQIALTILGQRDADGLLDRFEFQSRHFYNGEPWFMPWVLAYHKLLDRIGR